MKKSQSGFTLIELLVTITIFGILVLGIVNLFMATDRAQQKSYHLEIATRASEAQIESLRNSQYSNLEANTDIDFTESLPKDLPEPKSGTVQITEPETGLKRVDVTITYGEDRNQGSVKQSSYIGILGIGS